ncbi:protein FAM81B [Paralichthys olivaceus]|uniref:protein FAM81B n=1 Tax=Paralichthys olivaceus TaxID=8255 RepID=UPI003751CAB2
MSYESKLTPYQNHSRPDVLEGRLGGQERTLAVLLEQAFAIKAEVAAGLQSAKGSVQVEALSRKLLESHIMTITRIVKQLNVDIQALERQIAQRDSVTYGNSLAVQSLDQKTLAGIGDLRGRVARCDASIAKLSANVSSGERHMIRLQQEMKELRAGVDVKLEELEVKLHRDLDRLSASLTELTQNQRSSMCDLHRQVQLLDEKMSGGLREAKEQTDSLRKWTEQQLNSFLQTHAQSSQHDSQLQDKTLESESKLAILLHALEARVELSETQRVQSDQSHADRLKRCETKLRERVSSVKSSLHQELQLLKHEYLKGFRSVHDSMESLRQIGDIKSRLDKDELQNDNRHVQQGGRDQ